MKNKIVVLCGPSGSGKSTWATEYIKNNPDWVRVNRDDLRKQMMGELTQDYYKRKDLKALEGYISTLVDEQIRLFLSKGLNVIVDNTHIEKKYILHYFETFWDAEVSIKVFEVPLEELVSRVVARDGAIDTSYIGKQVDRFRRFNDMNIEPYVIHNIPIDKELPKCIIVDIDGTVADCSGRSPYDTENCHLDAPIDATRSVVKAVRGNWLKRITNPVNIVYLSGREDKYYEKTKQWLKDNNFPSGDIHMRKTGDQRSDWKIKYELFRDEVAPFNYPLFAIDDRKQIKRLWTKLGIFVFDVNTKDTIF